MFKKIYDILKEANLLVYSIGQHEGLCENPYVVIKENGQIPYLNVALDFDLIDIIIFYPLGRYSRIKAYRELVMESLSGIKELKFTNETTPIIIDDDKKAYTQSIKYQIYKRRRKR